MLRILKRRKFWLLAIVVVLAVGWVSGFLTGWWAKKGKLGEFPTIDANTRLLVVSPHPDDETLIAGGLIQRVLAKGGRVKIIFLTNGDGSRTTVVRENKKADLSPKEFVALGEQRMNEAIAADESLGLTREDLVFLGFPDQGLNKIYTRYYTKADGVGVSPTTKLDHVPYEGVLVPGQAYVGENLVGDVSSVIDDFKPTMVITTHIRDSHSDHRTAFLIVDRIRREKSLSFGFLATVVHYRGYPEGGDFLFPAKKLFGSDWVSLEITDAERANKVNALKKYSSQYTNLVDRELFMKLSGRNEIFETE